MKATKWMAVAALAVSGVVYADPTGESVDFNGFQSSRTRGEVQDELAQAPTEQRFALSESIDPTSFRIAPSPAGALAMCTPLTQEDANSRLARNDEDSSVAATEPARC